MTEHTPAPLPRRRDIHHATRTRRAERGTAAPRAERAVPEHHAAAPRTRRGAVRTGIPVALTVMALTTGVVAGLSSASSASGEPRAASSAATGTVRAIDTGTFGTTATSIPRPALAGADVATSGAVGSAADGARTDEGATPEGAQVAVPSGDEALTAAQAALVRADRLTHDSRAVPRAQRKAVAQSAAHLREVVAARTETPAASRAGERTSLSARGQGASDVTEATAKLTNLVEESGSSAVSIKPAPATPDEVLHAQAAAARKAAGELKKFADDTQGHDNGRIAAGDLDELSFASGETLRRDAAEQLERLDKAYRARFGQHLKVRGSYRSYDSQVSVKASRGYMAAVPGYSNHGWGVAVDLNGGVEEYSSAQHRWLVQHAKKFGWQNPGWAQADGRKPEAWHWEYKGL